MTASRAAQSRGDERTPGASGACDGPVRSTRPVRRGVSRHDNTVAGPSARDALRGRLGRRALRPPAARAVRRRPRPGRRGRLRRPGGAARADGAGRLPPAPGRPPACRGRLPGRLPRPGPQGPVDPRPRAAGQLALRRRAAHGPQGPRPARPPPPDRGRRIREAFGRARPPPPADRPILDREQAEALHGEIDRLPRAFRLPVVLCYFEGLTLDEAAHRLRWPGRHAPQPAGPGAREAPAAA